MPNPDTLVVLAIVCIIILVLLVWRIAKVDWKTVHWTAPTVLAAIIAGSAALGVAIASAISGTISAAYQSTAEREKTRGDLLERALLASDNAKTEEANKKILSDRISVLIQSGIISDDNGSICRAIVGGVCPLKVLNKP